MQQDKFITQQKARERWVKSLTDRNERRAFATGFQQHDQVMGYFLRGKVYLIAARPGVGKTAFLFSLAYRQVRSGVRAFFCNLEMSVEQMWNRLACLRDANLTLRDLNEAGMTPERAAFFTRLSIDLENFSPLFFESSALDALLTAARTEIKPGSNSMLFVDYVGLLTLRGLGPEQRYFLVSEAAKQLKGLARELEISVVAAVQLNREIEKRKDKTPTLSDLRDSGELENHADAVFALTREDRYVLEIDALKNRDGALGTYSLKFDGPRVAVEEFD